VKAIILAAGKGKRLSKVSNGLPKSMIKIGEKTLMQHQIDNCKAIGINDFVFVLGYQYDRMRDFITSLIGDSTAAFIRNPIFDKTNTLHSLWLAKDFFDEDFIYFNADILFKPELLEMREDHIFMTLPNRKQQKSFKK